MNEWTFSGMKNSEFARKMNQLKNKSMQKMTEAFEDFKANNQWLVETYWQWYYKGNDMYNKVMSYPEVQQLKAIASEMIKTVSFLFDLKHKTCTYFYNVVYRSLYCQQIL